MTFDEIVIEIRQQLGIPSTAVESVARIGRKVNHLYREITTSLGIDLTRRSVGVSAATTIGSPLVTFTNTEKIERVYDDRSGFIVLDEISMDEMRDRTAPSSDSPRYYAIQSWTATSVTIRLDVTPATVFNIKADVFAVVPFLTTTDVPAFPESFHPILVDGVCASELIKSEKEGLYDRVKREYERRLSDLRLWRALSITAEVKQGKTPRSNWRRV